MALVKYNNNSISAVTSASSIPSGALTHIKTLTASSSGTLSFVDGSDGVVLDSTYPIYKFEFINIHPSAGDNNFTVNFKDGGSSYDATKTTTFFRATHRENGSLGQLDYRTADDLAQSTSAQRLNIVLDADNDSCMVGNLTIFNPSSTVFVKHFIANTQEVAYQTTSHETFVAGYCNVTDAIDGVQFAMSSGNIDSGKIKLYGIKDS
jgi:hypothetical protein